MKIIFKSLIVVFAVFALTSLPVTSKAQLDVSIDVGLPTPTLVAIAPPAIPVYLVPAPPAEGVIWVPGYWHWNEWGYYWIPGTWVWPPAYGMLWTPGYWGWAGGNFAWHEGYWGPHVGFYGGINYGGGYNGSGFNGGSWNHGAFVVNRSITNVNNINIKNVTKNYSNAGFNGGPGGTRVAPTQQQQMAAKERHMPLTSEQVRHVNMSGNNQLLRASANGGKPPIATTAKPGVFNGKGIVGAKQAGARNALAEQHNQQVMQNPSAAKGAVPGNKPNVERQQAAGREQSNREAPSQSWRPSGTTKPMEASARGAKPPAFQSEQRGKPAEYKEQYPTNRKPMETSTREHMAVAHESEAKPEEHESEDKDRR